MLLGFVFILVEMENPLNFLSGWEMYFEIFTVVWVLRRGGGKTDVT